MPPPITPASAVVLLADWMTAHARVPTATECRTTNGLNHYTTYCKLWGGLSAAVSMALLALSGASALAPDAPVRRAQTRPCLRCGAQVPNRERHIRHCSSCRKVLFAPSQSEDEYDALPGSIKAELRETWDELLEQAVIQCR